jgi:ATP-dependent Lon protease
MKLFTKFRLNKSLLRKYLFLTKEEVILPSVVSTISIPSANALFGKDFSLDYIVVAYPDGLTTKPVGILSKVLQVLKMPDMGLKLVLEGVNRVKILDVSRFNDLPYVDYIDLQESTTVDSNGDSLLNTLWSDYQALVSVEQNAIDTVKKASTLHERFYKILSFVQVVNRKQKIDLLQVVSLKEQIVQFVDYFYQVKEGIQLKKEIDERIKKRMARGQREYYLQEQLKEIHKELGDNRSDPQGINEFKERFSKLDLADHAREKFLKEFKNYSRLQPNSPDLGILRGYIETFLDLPWNITTHDEISLDQAQVILDQGHYGMDKLKDRIIDFVAIRKINGGKKSPIICFVGPPGVGKTSLARSIAQALNRHFVSLSLGGVRDETEIRGHRRTYLGALPGKIIQTMNKAKSINPVFLLDEIDKMVHDGHRGDPASAMLEVLDPEQNHSFVDTYLEIGFDLSQVLFIATANSLSGIPYPLLDRMEVIEVSGYTDHEKVEILQRFLVPKQLSLNGLVDSQLHIDSNACLALIRSYTHESGVRQLEREVGRLIRKLVREKLLANQFDATDAYSLDEVLDEPRVLQLLGKPKYYPDHIHFAQSFGVALGLAWTEYGGRILPIEVQLIAGTGQLVLTGKLGEVMKESAQIALSFLRYFFDSQNLTSQYKEKDIHIHFPEGATPKDGPSAGITILSALYSAFMQKKPHILVAMTGELTLSGQILPIGGLKEKILAAHRYQIYTVIIPKANQKDLEDIPAEITQQLTVLMYDKVIDVLKFLFDL